MQPMPGRDIGVSAQVRREGQVLYTSSWAVVGIDRYHDSRIPSLQYAEADTHALAALRPGGSTCNRCGGNIITMGTAMRRERDE